MGSDHDTELAMLRVARSIGRERPVNIVTSFLGAHAVPTEFPNRADAYIDNVCIPALHVPPMQRDWWMRLTGSARA